MTLQLIKVDQRYTKKVALLHNVWNLATGSLLLSTTIQSQMFALDEERDETRVLVDCRYMNYQIVFNADGTVTSSVH
ncbi:hypothetical protein D3C85_372900 [compost metagenome]